MQGCVCVCVCVFMYICMYVCVCVCACEGGEGWGCLLLYKRRQQLLSVVFSLFL